MGRSDPLRELVLWLETAPPGTTVPASSLAERLAPLVDRSPVPVTEPVPLTWRERLWIVPPETRLGVLEVAEAIGRPRSWVYRHTSKRSEKAPRPLRRLDGELVFTAGEIRAWVEGHEALGASPRRAS